MTNRISQPLTEGSCSDVKLDLHNSLTFQITYWQLNHLLLKTYTTQTELKKSQITMKRYPDMQLMTKADRLK